MTTTEITGLDERLDELVERRAGLERRREEITRALDELEARFDRAATDGDDTATLARERRDTLDELADTDRACGPLDREIDRVRGLIARARDEAEYEELTRTLPDLLDEAAQQRDEFVSAIWAAERDAVAAGERVHARFLALRAAEEKAAGLAGAHQALASRLGLPERQWDTALTSTALAEFDRETPEYGIAVRTVNARGPADVLAALLDVLGEYVRRANGADLGEYLAAEPARRERARAAKVKADAAERERLIQHQAEINRLRLAQGR